MEGRNGGARVVAVLAWFVSPTHSRWVVPWQCVRGSRAAREWREAVSNYIRFGATVSRRAQTQNAL